MKQYISVNEYLMDRAKLEDLTPEQQANLNTLIPKVNELLERFGEYRKCNSGFRSMSDHLRIYKEKGITDKSKIPMNSWHLKAGAIDLEDKNRKLTKWCQKNVSILEELELWCEHPDATPSWLHIQIAPPKSGKRFFNP